MSWHPLDIDSPEEVSDEELFNILASDKTPTQYLMEKRYEELVRTNSELHEYRINHLEEFLETFSTQELLIMFRKGRNFGGTFVSGIGDLCFGKNIEATFRKILAGRPHQSNKKERSISAKKRHGMAKNKNR